MMSFDLENYSSIEEVLKNGASLCAEKVKRKQIINLLNYLNFKQRPAIINFKHKTYGRIISLPAYPVVSNDIVRCLWLKKFSEPNFFSDYEFLYLIIEKDLDLIIVKGMPVEITEECIALHISDGESIKLRRAKRYTCDEVKVELFQDGKAYFGDLIDFSSTAFRVIVTKIAPFTLRSISGNNRIYVIFKKFNLVLFSGECEVIKLKHGKKKATLVLSFPESISANFPGDRAKSYQHSLKPPPTAVFVHPLTGKVLRLEIEEVSTCKFIVTDDAQTSALFAGLIIPELKIETLPFEGIKCTAQVLRKIPVDMSPANCVKWEVQILDMSPSEQMKLASLVARAQDKRAYICPQVDLDSLFELFFSVGFLYPEKYSSLMMHKEQFKKIYKKLYMEAPSIAKYFVYQEKGKILAHLSMLRFYENTWLFQHHAAVGQHLAGLAVLKHAVQYVYDYKDLYSSHMDYLMCYFRPENKFPQRAFGGIVVELSNPKMYSIDTFAYLELKINKEITKEQIFGTLLEATEDDLTQVGEFYEYVSGGLMLEALDLTPEMINEEQLDIEYAKYGFKRKRKVYVLKKNGHLFAAIVRIVSDVGLNLSNLTNCIHVIVIREDLPLNMLIGAVEACASECQDWEKGQLVPVLIYPLAYIQKHQLNCQRIYNLWCGNSKYAEYYFEYMEKFFFWKGRG